MQFERVAVIGSGVAGLVAAHVLARSAAVTVFEAAGRPGGHAHTHDVIQVDGNKVAIDSGFIVHNDRTYPTLQRLFRELHIPTQPTDMSMSVRSERTGWQYAGGQGAAGIFADPRTSVRPQFVKMLLQVRRFHREATALLDSADDGTLTSIGDWLDDRGFSADFLEHFARPLVAAVWSCDPRDAMGYPARSLLTFLQHHGMLTVTGSPTWRTVTGGSRTYVEAVLAAPAIHLHCNAAVRSVRTFTDRVAVATDDDTAEFDAVVIATHPSVALGMLAEPSATATEILGSMRYSANEAQLHTDTTVLPSAVRARASWNYLLPQTQQDSVLVSYDLTRLMRLPDPQGQRFLVTLGGRHRVDQSQVVATMNYEHPLYDAPFIAAQRRLSELNQPRLAFAGAYHGWGFHEDGALSGLKAAQALGGAW
ncbi:NAD(P)/FAD-dependent oxidoreductase [Rudaeicoccus suwonensis]|uniref:Putative NAD/FAD-binding protein n=1 Tax=Rudaeicoccus suwonensis TaxID=657409 RepID=A0A561E103_9MICO|nr:FAD-dependent oxidoreductase [Rudaeicoccus suwonensis]TWE09318.1 putative NAD/FAD-binding protein [Rudaeicoccus suwonensis]